jgi:hypothetical protein
LNFVVAYRVADLGRLACACSPSTFALHAYHELNLSITRNRQMVDCMWAAEWLIACGQAP